MNRLAYIAFVVLASLFGFCLGASSLFPGVTGRLALDKCESELGNSVACFLVERTALQHLPGECEQYLSHPQGTATTLSVIEKAYDGNISIIGALQIVDKESEFRASYSCAEAAEEKLIIQSIWGKIPCAMPFTQYSCNSTPTSPSQGATYIFGCGIGESHTFYVNATYYDSVQTCLYDGKIVKSGYTYPKCSDGLCNFIVNQQVEPVIYKSKDRVFPVRPEVVSGRSPTQYIRSLPTTACDTERRIEASVSVVNGALNGVCAEESTISSPSSLVGSRISRTKVCDYCYMRAHLEVSVFSSATLILHGQSNLLELQIGRGNYNDNSTRSDYGAWSDQCLPGSHGGVIDEEFQLLPGSYNIYLRVGKGAIPGRIGFDISGDMGVILNKEEETNITLGVVPVHVSNTAQWPALGQEISADSQTTGCLQSVAFKEGKQAGTTPTGYTCTIIQENPVIVSCNDPCSTQWVTDASDSRQIVQLVSDAWGEAYTENYGVDIKMERAVDCVDRVHVTLLFSPGEYTCKAEAIWSCVLDALSWLAILLGLTLLAWLLLKLYQSCQRGQIHEWIEINRARSHIRSKERRKSQTLLAETRRAMHEADEKRKRILESAEMDEDSLLTESTKPKSSLLQFVN